MRSRLSCVVPIASKRIASLIGLGAVALAVRVAYVLGTGPRRLPFTDSLFYQLQADAIAHGHWFLQPFLQLVGRSTPTAAHPPLFPLILAAGSRLGATSVQAHQLMGCVIGAGTVVGVGLVATELAGDRAGLLAAALAAIYPPLWLNDGGIMAEGLFALISTGIVLASYRFATRPSPRTALVLGAGIGLAVLTRAEAILLLVVLVVPLVAAARHLGPTLRLRLLALTVLATMAVISPWVIRNLVTFQRPVLLSTGDGTIAGANCDPTYHGPLIGLWLISCYPPPSHGDESVADAAARHKGLAYAAHHLRRVPLVMAVRIGRVWDVYGPLQNGKAVEDGRPRWSTRVALFAYAALVPLALVGAVVLRRRRVSLLPLLAQVALVTVTAALVWGAIRFRAPAEVVLVVLGGVALDRIAPPPAARSDLEPTAGRLTSSF
jgi:hypothetical protein